MFVSFCVTEVGEQIIKFGGLEPIIEMVSSEHDIMQNEALIALAVVSSTVKGEHLERVSIETGKYIPAVELVTCYFFEL